MKKQILLSSFVACVACAFAKETTRSVSGTWDDDLWTNGRPGEADRAKIGGNAIVTADGLDVVVSTNMVGSADGATYRQSGGTYTSGQLTELYTGAANMEFVDTDVTLNGYRMVVGHGGVNECNARFGMVGGTLLQNLTSGAFMTSIWGRKGRSEIVLSNVTWKIQAGNVQLGFGSINTNVLEVVGGRIEQGKSRAIQLGANVNNYLSPVHAWNEMTVRDAVWTADPDALAVYAPASTTNDACLRIENTTATLPNVVVGSQVGTTGTVEIVGGAVHFNANRGFELAAGRQSSAHLILNGVTNANELAAKITYKAGGESETILEIVNSAYTLPVSGGGAKISTNARKNVLVLRDGTFDDVPVVYAATAGEGRLVLSNTIWRAASARGIFGAYANGVTGRVEIIDSTVNTAGGNLTAADNSDAATAFGKLIVRGGSVDLGTGSLMVPRQGIGHATFGGDLVFTSQDAFMPNMTGARGMVRIEDDALLTIRRRCVLGNQASIGVVEVAGGRLFVSGEVENGNFSVGSGDDSDITLKISGGMVESALPMNMASGARSRASVELKGGTLSLMRVAASAKGMPEIHFDGGVLKVRSAPDSTFLGAAARLYVEDGGAVIDSNGLEVNNMVIEAGLLHGINASGKDGGLVKKGGGTFKLTGASTFTGDVIVEEGTLDMSRATFELGPNAVLGGAGTLKTPAAGLTVNGTFTVDPEKAAGPLTVQGTVTFGADARVTVTDASKLDTERTYALLEATTLGGPVPALDDALAAHWCVRTKNGRLTLSPNRGLLILFH